MRGFTSDLCLFVNQFNLNNSNVLERLKVIEMVCPLLTKPTFMVTIGIFSNISEFTGRDITDVFSHI